MDYLDWKALHEGYDAQRTVMYRKMLLEQGNLLEFFKGIYFFVESLAVIGTVPAATRSSPRSSRHGPAAGRAAGRRPAPPARPGHPPATARCR